MGCTNSKKALKNKDNAEDPNVKKPGKISIQQKKLDSGQKSQVKRTTPRKKDSNSQISDRSSRSS